VPSLDERLLEAAPSAMQSQTHVRLRTAEHIGDRRPIEVIPDRQQQHLPVLLAEPSERGAHRLRRSRGLGENLGDSLAQPRRECLSPPGAAAGVQPDVPRDADEPWPRVLWNIIEPPPRNEERFRDDVVGVRRVAAPGVAAYRFEMLFVEPVEPSFSCRCRIQVESSGPRRDIYLVPVLHRVRDFSRQGDGRGTSPPVRNLAQLLGVEHWPKLNDQFAPPDDECSTAATFATGPPLGPRMLKNAVSVVTKFPAASKLPPNQEAPASR